MSGQVLLRGLFEEELTRHYQSTKQYPVIPLHIADRDRDVVDANKHDCPKLAFLQQNAMQSPDFQRFDTSHESEEVRRYMWNTMKMGNETRNSILDCLMCTICTDRPLPAAVDEYDGTDDNWFSRLATYDTQSFTLLMKYNQSEFAKLALGPLWYEIMVNINPFLTETQTVSQNPAPKLALFSGHDTTIMPLLASLGSDVWNDTEWAPYASMMLIEIHELIDGQSDPTLFTSNFAFRLLYNGKVLTPLVGGCPETCELCDIAHLKSKVDPIATRNTDCAAPTLESSPSPAFLYTSTGIAMFASLVFLSGFSGSCLTFFIMKRRLVRYVGRTTVDHDGTCHMDDADDNFGLEMREENFQDEGHNTYSR
jgi:hypothetical protein